MDKFILDHHHPMIGSGSQNAQHEIHIFLGPLNPDRDTVKKYYDAVNEWNEINQHVFSAKFGDYKMKACLLCLIFRKEYSYEENPINVMQSSVYIRSNSMLEIINETRLQKLFFEKKGFVVIREKIEAMAYGINGIPQYDNDIPIYPLDAPSKSPYFEFHIKCQFDGLDDSSPITNNNINTLKKCSNVLTLLCQSPCPLSYNINPDQFTNDKQGHQRFLNVRFRNMGIKNIEANLTKVKNLIQDQIDIDSGRPLKILKVISEYVWYDTAPIIDAGWIDFNINEKLELLDYLQKQQILAA